MERSGLFLDVYLYGKEVPMDKVRDLRVGIDLGIQPGTRASGGSSTEVQQYGLVLLLGLRERGIDIFRPLYRHTSSFPI
jgi:hypothetical protein